MATAVELQGSSSGTNTFVTVGTGTTVVRTAKQRRELTLTNDSDTGIYIALGAAAVLGRGIYLAPYGGSWTTQVWDGAVNAISSVAGKNLCIAEVF